MARPGQDPVSKDDVPWWMKFAGRGVGTIGGFRKYHLSSSELRLISELSK